MHTFMRNFLQLGNKDGRSFAHSFSYLLDWFYDKLVGDCWAETFTVWGDQATKRPESQSVMPSMDDAHLHCSEIFIWELR